MRQLLLLILILSFTHDAWARRRTKRSKTITDWETSVGILYSNYNAKLTNLTKTTSGFKDAYVIDIDNEFENGTGFIVERRSIEDHSWGASVAVEYFTKRQLDKIKYNSYSPAPIQTGTVITCTGADNCGSIQTTNILLNIFYQWEKYYIPFGLVYGLHDYKEANYSSSTKNSYGLNLGFGSKMKDQYLIELNSRVLQFNLDQTDSVGDQSQYKGIISIFTIGVKYLF